MEALLPSEVARLVYGYLHENCHVAAQVFIENSPNLKECHHALTNGRRFNTNIEGKNLFDLLDLLFLVKSTVKRIAEEYERLKARPSRTVLSLLKLFDIRHSSRVKRKPATVENSKCIKEKVKKTRKLIKDKVSEMKIRPMITGRRSSSTSPPPDKFENNDFQVNTQNKTPPNERSTSPVHHFNAPTGRGSSEEEWAPAGVTMKQEVESDDSDVMEVVQSAPVQACDSGDPHDRTDTPVSSFERAVTPPYTPPRAATSVPVIMPSSASTVAPPFSLSTASLTNIRPSAPLMPRRHILPQQPTRPITNSRRPSYPSAGQQYPCSQSILPKPYHQR